MNLKNKKTFLVAAVLLSSIFTCNSLAQASEDFEIFYYEEKDIDALYVGRENVENTTERAKKEEIQKEEVKAAPVLTYYIEDLKAYSKDESGKVTPVVNDFVNVDGYTYYADQNSDIVRGLINVNGNFYYFDEFFEMVKGEEIISEDRVMVADENGVISFPANKQVTVDGINYVTDQEGYMSEVVVKESAFNLEALNGLSKLEQNNDELSPLYNSGLSASQLEQVINKAYPNNKLIKNNDPNLTKDFANTLVAIENQLGINPIFMLGIINAENPIMSGKFSNIVRDKNNLMSWNAYDDDPYNKATKFNSYSAAIILPAKFLRTNYLDSNGKYYVDGTVKGVNKYYATAKNWNVNVTSGMKRLNEARKSLGY